ncbi:fumarylacetoacetate hydrolase family protein [Actinoplanes sp. NPDC051851]|uniref:2-keto-4-pentenoate hydratase n=1 Tax=Actinoplanes sp. NPDC051851 TaxID=3154753 RepID=UPI00341B1610
MTTLIITDEMRRAADRLRRAEQDRSPCTPVRELFGSPSAATGYGVQSLLVRDWLAEGRRPVGHKIGLTSPAVQAQLGVDQPDFGVLFKDMECPPDIPIDVGRLMQPRIEAEIAFILGSGLDHDHIDEDAARSAVDVVVPALEIVDSRIAGWNITIADTIADNASSGLYVLGRTRTRINDLDLRRVGMRMSDGSGDVVSTGSGAACLGDPITALVWLARTSRDLGNPLRAGDLVLSGALGPMVPVTPGASFTATLTGLGDVHARFTEKGDRRHRPT